MNTLTWEFYAPNVHDFAWAADPEYSHDVVTSESGVDYIFYNPPSIKRIGKNFKVILQSFWSFLRTLVLILASYSVIQGGTEVWNMMCTMITGERQLL